MAETAPEILQFPANLVKEMEYVSGVNAVSRGQPEASYRSGAALALVDAKTNQFNSTLGAAYNSLLSSVGTSVIKIMQKEIGTNKRVIALAGPGRITELKEFTAADLDKVDHVVVTASNAYVHSTPGRKEIADLLLQNKLVNTGEEYINLLETGQLRPLVETIESQNQLIHEENEALLGMKPVTISKTDNHILHIKKHAAPVDSMDFRQNEMALQFVLTHIQLHQNALMIPEVQALQIAMGYASPQELQIIMQLTMPQPPPPPPEEKGQPGQPKPPNPEGHPPGMVPSGNSNGGPGPGPGMPSRPPPQAAQGGGPNQ